MAANADQDEGLVPSGKRQRRVLMFAFHFPPLKGSSGLQRTMNFARDLPSYGWRPKVISVWPAAYPSVSDELMGSIPSDLSVKRLPCIDVARHLSIGGRYPSMLAMPDRWWTWLFSALPAGMAQVLKWKPDVIWATYPIPTAVVAGRMLAAITGKPLVSDLRDSITEDNYPADARLRSVLRRIEKKVVHASSAVVFTSQGALDMYADRYPGIPHEKWVKIPNGFDEAAFKLAESLPDDAGVPNPARRLRLVHSGLLDPVDRNPRPFLEALASVRSDGACDLAGVEIVLRATAHDKLYRTWIDELCLTDVVRLAPSLPYHAALREMLDADGLLIFQGRNCNHQTPAKLYEYMRAGRPIFAIADRDGDTL
jgi:glycosyltransferase involved in cell wall biosynthesis